MDLVNISVICSCHFLDINKMIGTYHFNTSWNFIILFLCVNVSYKQITQTIIKYLTSFNAEFYIHICKDVEHAIQRYFYACRQ